MYPALFSLSRLSVTEKLIAYQREFHALKERLRVAEHRTLQRSSELNTILEQFRRAIAETNSSKDALTNFSGKTPHPCMPLPRPVAAGTPMSARVSG